MSVYRVIVLISTYSWDYIQDITHEDESCRIQDNGPDEHTYALAGIFASYPNSPQIESVLKRVQDSLDNNDSTSKILAFTVMNDIDWQSFCQSHCFDECQSIANFKRGGYGPLAYFGRTPPSMDIGEWTTLPATISLPI